VNVSRERPQQFPQAPWLAARAQATATVTMRYAAQFAEQCRRIADDTWLLDVMRRDVHQAASVGDRAMRGARPEPTARAHDVAACRERIAAARRELDRLEREQRVAIAEEGCRLLAEGKLD
jgi:hypothetical protein